MHFFDWDCDYDDAFIPKGSILPKVHDLTYCALPTPEGDEAAVWETGYGNAIPWKKEVWQCHPIQAITPWRV